MKHPLRNFAVSLIFLLTSIGPSSGAEIDWKVAHPFRFFTERSDFQLHMDAYDEVLLANPAEQDLILAMERKLNDQEWLKGWIARNAEVTGTYEFSKGKKLYAEYKDANGQLVRQQPQKGWASLIESRASTCWDEAKQSHLPCHVDDFVGEPRTRNLYVKPNAHTVSLTLKDAPAGICQWAAMEKFGGFKPKSKLEIFIDGQTLTRTASADCKAAVLARIPFAPDLDDSEKGVPVQVTLPDGTIVKAPPIWVQDRLVVGFGDSYSSGEGNPDTPVTLEVFPSAKSIKAFRDGDVFKLQPNAKGAFSKHPGIATFKAYPVAAKGSRAQWLDRKCHRSAYSYHLRTAIQLAIRDYKNSNGHSALTFLGYACSGAEITEGILGAYSGAEANPDIQKSGSAALQNLSQINRLNLDLCLENPLLSKGRPVDGLIDVEANIGAKITGSKRPVIFGCKNYARDIDLLIISVGGNDVGFAPLIAYVLLGNDGVFPGYSNVTQNFKNKALASLANLFGVRHDIKEATKKIEFLFANYSVLNAEAGRLPLAKGGGALPIVLTGFPNFATDENAINCGSETDTTRKIAAQLDGMSTTGVLSVGPSKLNEAVTFAEGKLLPKMAESAAKLGWTFVDGHVLKFKGHGFCAKRMDAQPAIEAENLSLPFFADAKGTLKAAWFLGAPEKMLPYAKRQRWIRTFHDTCLMAQFDSKGGSISAKTKLTSLDYLQACLGGPMHPTAEGHAAYADATYQAAKKLMGIK